MANLNLNKVILGGRITADIELKQTPSGVSVCTFSIAVNRKGKEAQTDFIDCVAWRQTAEFISRYFKKGSSICIVGTLQKREWTDKNGQKRYVTEVIAEEANFVDSKNDSASVEPPAFAEASAPQFEEVADDDKLPF
jgi:single-strand DNA-binding protein